MLLSTVVTLNAFDPYDTSGKPDFGDFDDPSGGPLATPHGRDYGKTSLEQEAEKQAKKKPVVTPQPQKKHNPFLEQEIKKRQQEIAHKEKATNFLTNELLNIYEEIERQNGILQKEKAQEAAYNEALFEITEKKRVTRTEKVLASLAIATAAAGLVSTTVEEAPKYALTAVLFAFGSTVSYFLRLRKCNNQAKQLTTAYTETKIANASTPHPAPRTKKELIAQAEVTLTQLKTVAPHDAQDTIRHFEARLENLKA